MSEDPKQDALAAIEGLEIGDVLKFFYARATERDTQIADMVKISDELETDGAVTSEGEDNGAFVLAWTWVSFYGTKFTKICECCDDNTDEPVTAVKLRHDDQPQFWCKECVEEAKCPGCGAIEGTEAWGTVGDGFDGYCPSCADKREEDGTVELG